MCVCSKILHVSSFWIGIMKRKLQYIPDFSIFVDFSAS